MKLISVQETLCILHLTCIMKCYFSHINLTAEGIPCILHLTCIMKINVTFIAAIPKFRKSLCTSHMRITGKKRVYVWGNTYPVPYAENGIITRASICNKSIHILLNLYNLLHNSEQVPCTTVVICSPRLAIFGKNVFLLFTAYFASVESWLVRDLVSVLGSLPCADAVN